MGRCTSHASLHTRQQPRHLLAKGAILSFQASDCSLGRHASTVHLQRKPG